MQGRWAAARTGGCVVSCIGLLLACASTDDEGVSSDAADSATVPITYRAFGTTTGTQTVSLWRGVIVFSAEAALTPELDAGIVADVEKGQPVRIDVAPPTLPQPGSWGCEILGSDSQVLAHYEVESPTGENRSSAVCEAVAE